jgi:hypothetical protein
MQLTINITKKNKGKVFKLIETLLEDEIENVCESTQIIVGDQLKNISSVEKDYLDTPPKIENFKDSKVIFYHGQKNQGENYRIKSIGSWGQFNSFFPIKAASRILTNYLYEKSLESVKLNEFVDKCLLIFEQKGYTKYRGFPSSDKDTARGRFVWHFLTTAYEMGLIRISNSNLGSEGMPRTLLDWKEVEIDVTKDGMEFALLPNNIFDGISDQQVLTTDEKEWMISYLIKIDEEGYKEYSLLKGISKFLAEKHNGKDDLWGWFKNNNTFVEYIKSWSRKTKKGDEQALTEQIDTLSKSFASSKVALLRELGIVKNKRNDYTILEELN